MVGEIEDHFVRVASSHESVRHGAADFEHLVVRGDQLVELKGGVRVHSQMADLVLVHVYVDALVVGEASACVHHGHHLVFVDLARCQLLLCYKVSLLGHVRRVLFGGLLNQGVRLNVFILNVDTSQEKLLRLRFGYYFDLAFASFKPLLPVRLFGYRSIALGSVGLAGVARREFVHGRLQRGDFAFAVYHLELVHLNVVRLRS